ncbi:MAG: hypothetical protein Fur0042_12540 [Cyanophyceae cyanobacterium]
MPSFFLSTTLTSRKSQLKLTAKRKAIIAAKKSESIGGKIARLGGSLITEGMRFFNIELSDLWGTVSEAYYELKQFDWNQTDKEIQNQIEQNNKSLMARSAQIAGETLGRKVGGKAVGGLIGIVEMQSVNKKTIKIPVISDAVVLALQENDADEALANLRSLVGAVSATAAKNLMLQTLLYARRNELLGQKSITNEDLPNGSFSEKIEKKMEKLGPTGKLLAENFLEGFEDGFFESGYVAMSTVDGFVDSFTYAQENSPIRTVEVIDPDGNEYTVTSTQNNLVQEIINPSQSSSDDPDIYFGPIPMDIIPMPVDRFIKVIFRSESHQRGGRKGYVYSELLLPGGKKEIKPEMLNGLSYTHGNTKVSTILKNGRRLTVYCSSESDGKSIINQALKALSTEKLRDESFKVSKVSRDVKAHRMTAYKAVVLDNTKQKDDGKNPSQVKFRKAYEVRAPKPKK